MSQGIGASGAGKSSLLKAGIIPRLRREAPAWLPLRAFRPGADPLLNFAEALARTLADFGTIEAHGDIRDRLSDAWFKAERAAGALTLSGMSLLDETLDVEGSRLRGATSRSAATVLINVDQAEELASAEGASADALADYLRIALASTRSSWQLAFTIRTDSFPELQAHQRFQHLKARGYDLRGIPVFRFDSVVQEPAKRYGVEVDDELVDILMEDAPKEDALPLLAFVLQRLWRQYAASGRLTKTNYERVGGRKGLIEEAAERALRGLEPEQDVPLATGPASKRAADIAAATFVPALAQINQKGAPIRRVASWQSFDDEQQGLLARFDRWRLVVRRADARGGTVEVSHEALFREWKRLKGWLEPERTRLDMLRSLEIDAAAWESHGRDRAFLNHRGRRLLDASELAENERYRDRLLDQERSYLAACWAGERASQRVYIYAVLLGVGIALVGWMNEARIGRGIKWLVFEQPFKFLQFRPFVKNEEDETAFKKGLVFQECRHTEDCPEMVVISSGKFTMGAPESYADAKTNERPVHEVSFERPFAVSAYSITMENWNACVGYGDCEGGSDGGLEGGKQPVINLSWDDAQRYVAWLSRMTGKTYRLLSEAEYEYVARGGHQTIFPWGDDIGKGNANCVGCGSKWDGLQPAPVGQFKPNGFGAFDMVGNVLSWVQDCVHNTYDGAPGDGSAWIGDDHCDNRVARGGSWGGHARIQRVTVRYWLVPSSRVLTIGLRVARDLARPDRSHIGLRD